MGRLQGQHAADKSNALADVLTPSPLQPPPTLWALFRVGCPWVPPSFWMVYWCVLVRVSGECPTAISSLDEGECESGVSGDPEDHSDTPHMCSEEPGRGSLLTWWLATLIIMNRISHSLANSPSFLKHMTMCSL